MRTVFHSIFGRSFQLQKRVILNLIRRIAHRKIKHRFLFIYSPPYSGSTLLTQCIASSKAVSVNNPYGTMEGQRLPEVEPILFTQARWDPGRSIPWTQVRNYWERYWQPDKLFCLEKSPPNSLHISEIKHCFSPHSSIILVRHPFAIYESLLRRDSLNPEIASKRILLIFRKLYEEAQNDALVIRYEDFVSKPQLETDRIKKTFPLLGELRVNQSMVAHNRFGDKSLRNTNEMKYTNLQEDERDAIKQLIENHASVFQFFEYTSSQESLL